MRRVFIGCSLVLILNMALAPFVSAAVNRSGNKVLVGENRFDILTPSLIRLQYAPKAIGFVDAPTAVVTNRDLAFTDFNLKEDKGWVELTTPSMTLRYKMNSGPFTDKNLRILWKGPKTNHEWFPGTKDTANLGGPFSSFNEIIEQTRPGNALPPFPDGPLSRSGYYLLDDSRSPVWDDKSQWIQARKESKSQDWYFFVYGNDYKSFFKDYIALAGKIPMVSKYTLGAWVTDLNFEYFNQDIKEQYLHDIVARFRRERIPLDIFVLDFAWHLYGWKGSLDWIPNIPDPKAFLKKMRDNGIRVSLNDHPSCGLFFMDSRIPDARKKLGLPKLDLPNFTSIENDWLFKVDPKNQGVDEKWFASDYDDSNWMKLPRVSNWEEAGFPNYDGFAWYRKTLIIPESLAGKQVFIIFGGVDDEYDLYVNGTFVTRYGKPGESFFNKMTSTDITNFVRYNQPNVIALRVKDWGHFGGISKWPVAVNDSPIKDQNMYFNLADQREAQVYMDYHNEILDQGVAFWWIDGEYAVMPGLNSQMWTNKVYYDAQEKHTGIRSFIFSRFGGPGSHRYPGFFTGDAYSTWKVLEYEVPYTLKAGNALIPYVTHDIGGFFGLLDNDFELYARWVQFGALSPIFRLHSCHENLTKGNARLPWVYGAKGISLVRDFLHLRYSLIPFLYTYCREAHDTGMPVLRPLYLEYPSLDEAYNHMDQYLIGRELLVAPILTQAKNGIAARDIYLPPGEWIDYFSRKKYLGARIIRYDCPLEKMPIFIKEGSIVPKQPEMAYVGQKPVDPLILDIYPGNGASFKLYEDDGLSLDYAKGRFSWTQIDALPDAEKSTLKIIVGAAQGSYNGQPGKRGYKMNVYCRSKPKAVMVNGRWITDSEWKWIPASYTAVIPVKSISISNTVNVTIRF